jgi:hypothetical protein
MVLLGTWHMVEPHWQQSFGPPNVGVGCGVGVLATQSPASVQAESRSGVQPSGHMVLLGTWHMVEPHWQQSFGPPKVGVGIGVGVLATQSPASVQAESRSGVQPSGHMVLLGTWHMVEPHWQQSFGPPKVGVGMGVGVLATQTPAIMLQAESRTSVQPCGQVPLLGIAQMSPSQSQQSFAPRVGVRVGVGVVVGVFSTQPTSATQEALKSMVHPSGHLPATTSLQIGALH